jgi:hypothetical protein
MALTAYSGVGAGTVLWVSYLGVSRGLVSGGPVSGGLVSGGPVSSGPAYSSTIGGFYTDLMGGDACIIHHYIVFT